MKATGRVIKSSEIEKILESEKEKGRAVSEADMIRRRAFEDGRTQAAAETAAMLAHAADIRNRAISESRKEIVSLAVKIAGRIVQKEIQVNPSVVVEMIDRAVDLVMEKTRLSIRANPEDIPVAESMMQKGDRDQTHDAIDFVPDRDVERGGCIIDCSLGRIDARLETILNRIKNELSG